MAETVQSLEGLASLKPAAPEAPKYVQKIDAQGRAYATGKRKNAVARVWIKPGSGKILVNTKTVEVFFARPVLRMLIQQPLVAANRTGQYDVTCTVSGGGLSGQAGVPRHLSCVGSQRDRKGSGSRPGGGDDRVGEETGEQADQQAVREQVHPLGLGRDPDQLDHDVEDRARPRASGRRRDSGSRGERVADRGADEGRATADRARASRKPQLGTAPWSVAVSPASGATMPKPSVALCSAKPITSSVASAISLAAAACPIASPSAKLCRPMPTAISSASRRAGRPAWRHLGRLHRRRLRSPPPTGRGSGPSTTSRRALR